MTTRSFHDFTQQLVTSSGNGVESLNSIVSCKHFSHPMILRQNMLLRILHLITLPLNLGILTLSFRMHPSFPPAELCYCTLENRCECGATMVLTTTPGRVLVSGELILYRILTARFQFKLRNIKFSILYFNEDFQIRGEEYFL